MAADPSWSGLARGQANFTASNTWKERVPSGNNGAVPRRKRERKTSESTIDQFNHRCRSVKGDIGSINRQLCLPINMAPTLGGIKRYTSPEASTPRTPLLLLGTTVASLLMGIVEGADISTTYLKPTVSSTACVGSTEQIAAKTEALGNDGACMQCDPAINVCPPGCQALIEELYVNCDGVTTPDGLYYDPNNAIAGEWSDNVKATVKIATERCGCNLSSPTSQPRVVVGTVALMTLLSLATWWFSTILF